MARRRKTSLAEDSVRLIAVLLLIGFPSLASFWNSFTSQNRLIFGVLFTALILTGIALLIVVVRYRKRQRELAWRRAMSAWRQSRHEEQVIHNQSARHFSPSHLEKFTAELFKQMGYQVSHTGRTGDHGIDVRLVNPRGEVELVQCKQWTKPVGEPEVRDLAGAMVHEKAVRAFIIAPGGFSASARQWAKGKRIVLADEKEINRLVQSAYGGTK